MSLLGGKHMYGMLLAVIAAAILALGFFFKPKDDSSPKSRSDLTTIQSEVERLREFTQRNSLRNATERFSTLANEAAAHSLLMLPAHKTGWLLHDRTLVTVVNSRSEVPLLSIRTAEAPVRAAALNWGAGVPVVQARANGQLDATPVRIAAADEVAPGAWVLMVSRTSEGKIIFSPGNYSGLSSATCGWDALPVFATNIPLPETAEGAGIFALDGSLVALVVRCDSGLQPVSMDALTFLASEVNSHANGIFAGWGMRVSPVSGDWAQFFQRSQGAVVTDVWKDWPADRAGVAPGDVIVAVNGISVQEPDELATLLNEAQPELKLEISRFGRTTSKTLKSEPAADTDARAVELRNSRQNEIADVASGSSAARAGLAAGDVLLSVQGINGALGNRVSAERLLASMKVAAPLLVVAQRGERKFAIVVMP